VVGRDAQRSGGHHGIGTAHQNPVTGTTRDQLDPAEDLLERTYGPKVALAVEALFAYERRGTVWTDTGRAPVEV
jgi:hypothetical protein